MRPTRAVTHALLFWVCLALPAHGQESPGADLQLGPGDALRVELKDEPHLGGEFQVGSDGYVLVPVIGRVQVTGRPFTEVGAELTAAYAAELTDPVVQITPLLRIAVLGEVRQPGLLTVDPTFTMAEVLAAAGGLTPLADRERISLLRGGQSVIGRLDPNSAIPAVALRSGDQVFVSRQSWFRTNSAVLIGAAASFATAAVTALLIR